MSRTGKYVETEGRLVVDSGGAGGGEGKQGMTTWEAQDFFFG